MALRLLLLWCRIGVANFGVGIPYNATTTTTTTTRLATVLPVAMSGYCVAQLLPPGARLSVAYVGGAIYVSMGGMRLRSVPCYAPRVRPGLICGIVVWSGSTHRGFPLDVVHAKEVLRTGMAATRPPYRKARRGYRLLHLWSWALRPLASPRTVAYVAGSLCLL